MQMSLFDQQVDYIPHPVLKSLYHVKVNGITVLHIGKMGDRWWLFPLSCFGGGMERICNDEEVLESAMKIYKEYVEEGKDVYRD